MQEIVIPTPVKAMLASFIVDEVLLFIPYNLSLQMTLNMM